MTHRVAALRGIVDDVPSLEDLPWFDAVDAAVRWKAQELPR